MDLSAGTAAGAAAGAGVPLEQMHSVSPADVNAVHAVTQAALDAERRLAHPIVVPTGHGEWLANQANRVAAADYQALFVDVVTNDTIAYERALNLAASERAAAKEFYRNFSYLGAPVWIEGPVRVAARDERGHPVAEAFLKREYYLLKHAQVSRRLRTFIEDHSLVVAAECTSSAYDVDLGAHAHDRQSLAIAHLFRWRAVPIGIVALGIVLLVSIFAVLADGNLTGGRAFGIIVCCMYVALGAWALFFLQRLSSFLASCTRRFEAVFTGMAQRMSSGATVPQPAEDAALQDKDVAQASLTVLVWRIVERLPRFSASRALRTRAAAEAGSAARLMPAAKASQAVKTVSSTAGQTRDRALPLHQRSKHSGSQDAATDSWTASSSTSAASADSALHSLSDDEDPRLPRGVAGPWGVGRVGPPRDYPVFGESIDVTTAVKHPSTGLIPDGPVPALRRRVIWFAIACTVFALVSAILVAAGKRLEQT